MVDFLFAVGQLLCVLGLLYGLILTLSHRDCLDSMRTRYDPLTGHDWLHIRIVPIESTPQPHIVAESETIEPTHEKQAFQRA